MIRRALLMLLVVGGALAVFGSGASAYSTPNHVSNWGVTQYMTVYYNQTSCGSNTGYQIYKVSAHWVRGSTNQEVEDDNYNAGIVGGVKCSGGGENVSDNADFSFAAMNTWSCGDAYHSCPVSRSYSWPYVRSGASGTEAGANLKGHIYNRGNDTFYGYLCTHVYLLGNGDCG